MDSEIVLGFIDILQPQHVNMLKGQAKTICFQVCNAQLQGLGNPESIDGFTCQFSSADGRSVEVDCGVLSRQEVLPVREPFQFILPTGRVGNVWVEFTDGTMRDTGMVSNLPPDINQGSPPNRMEWASLLPVGMSRLTLSVARVQVMRLNEVTDEMAQRAGYGDHDALIDSWDRTHETVFARASNNPWIWVIHVASVESTWEGET